MKQKRPLLITFILDLNLLSAFLLIISLSPKFAKHVGIYSMPSSNFSEKIIKTLMVIVLLIISYGFLRLKRWSFFLMLTYNIFFIVVAIIFLLNQNGQSAYAEALIPSVLGLILTIPTKRYFPKKM